MKLDEVQRLLDNLLHPLFIKECGRLFSLELGGMAEPLLHPQLLDVLRLFKKYYATKRTILYTNALYLNEKLILGLIKDHLITDLVVSIDGLTDKEYCAVKGINFETVEVNILQFIAIRKSYRSPCRITINILTYRRYVDFVRELLKKKPLRIRSVDPRLKDNTSEIIKKWEKRCSSQDEVRDASAFFQLRGEYEKGNNMLLRDTNILLCPWEFYVMHSLFITSNGDWIMCCNDFYKEYVLGNFLQTSLYKIAVSKKRERFIGALIRNNIDSLPPRCAQKIYCRFLHPSAVSSNFSNYVRRLKRGG